MAKYVTVQNKRLVRRSALVQSSGTSTDAHKIVETNDEGKLDQSLLPITQLTQTTQIMKSGAAIAGDKLLTLDADGKVIVASYTNPYVLGFTKQAVNAADLDIVVILAGVVTVSGAAFDLDTPIFLATNGSVTQDIADTADVIAQVGRPVTSTSFLLDVEAPIL
jgi:hypothetical protein